jgi:hypothetical protein
MVARSGPVWPRVLGIIAIVLGGLGAAAGAWGLLGSLIFFFPIMPKALAEWQAHWRWWMLTDAGVRTGLAALLIAAGIGLINERRWSVRSIVAWASIRAVWSIIQTGMGAAMSAEQMKAMSSQGPGLPPAFASMIGLFTAMATFVIGLAPAVFVLVWFTRAKVRAQTADWT